MQRSCQHLIYTWAAELESELHCATALRAWVSSWYYMGSDRRLSSQKLVRSASCILSDFLVAS
jgi:hypothetical protein